MSTGFQWKISPEITSSIFQQTHRIMIINLDANREGLGKIKNINSFKK